MCINFSSDNFNTLTDVASYRCCASSKLFGGSTTSAKCLPASVGLLFQFDVGSHSKAPRMQSQWYIFNKKLILLHSRQCLQVDYSSFCKCQCSFETNFLGPGGSANNAIISFLASYGGHSANYLSL